MTTVTARAEKGHFTLLCEGHAEGDDPAVCTAISTLCCTLELWCANAGVKYECEKEPGHFRISFGQGHRSRTAFDLVLWGLLALQHDHETYLRVFTGKPDER